MYQYDNRIIMTLDAGGTNFVFTAIQACREIIEPIRLDAVNDNVERCLETLVTGFRKVEALLPEKPVAISFAFPGPADYENGVIGDLPNFPCFRDGVAMGPFLAETFDIPVFINNDGNLFAYGEAMAGQLPEINKKLAASGSSRIYKNLLGVTLGTGFGGGVVIDGTLLRGDNGCGGDLWLMNNNIHRDKIAEESVSIRAVKRVYHEIATDDERDLSPKDIFDIAEGVMCGNMEAARAAFSELGKVAAGAIAHAINIVDGIIVIGGGLAGAAKYIIPSLVAQMRTNLTTFSGLSFPVIQSEIFDLTDEADRKKFLADDDNFVCTPVSGTPVKYRKSKKIAVALSSIGASTAISLGAYTFALNQIDSNQSFLSTY